MIRRLSEPQLHWSPALGRESAPALLPHLPLDLREWVAPATLEAWIEEEILGLDWHHPLVIEHLRLNPEFRPKVMLRLLSFGYATQTFSTREMVSRCHTEPAFASLCEGRVPFPHELTGFRRKNRRLLVKILAGVFSRALHFRFPRMVAGPNTADSTKTLEDRANARLDIARHMDIGDDD